MKRLFLLILSIGFLSAFAQQEELNPIPQSMSDLNPTEEPARCGYPMALKLLEKQGRLESFLEWHQASVELFQQQKEELLNNPHREIHQVPVVVHVVHNGTPQENVTDEQIALMLENLNKDYARTNADAGQTRPQFQAVASAVNIRFCLARTDPNGNATTGIVRKQTSHGWFNPDQQNGNSEHIKFTAQGGDDAWDTEHYLNIWIGNLTQGQGYGIMGYSTLADPNNIGNPTDGFIMDCVAVANGDLDRTPTHEIGHYFGLVHPWGPGSPGEAGPNGGDCNADDGFNDTPNTDQNNIGLGCDANPVNCGSEDQFENFMAYSNCTNMFTQEQAAYMENTLLTIRNGLLESNLCELPILTADFTPNTLQNVNTGQEVVFTDASSGPNQITDWKWTFEGGEPAEAEGQGPHTVVYNQAGTFSVKLVVSDANGEDEELKENLIEVTSVLNADFSASAVMVGLNETVVFTDLSTGPDPITTWKWQFGDGTPNATVQGPIQHTYTELGTYTVKLTVGDGMTLDSKEMEIEVYDPDALNIIDFTGTPLVININEDVTFNLECNQEDDLIDSVRWMFPGTEQETVFSTNTEAVTVTYNQGGVFPVEARAYRLYGTDGDTLLKPNYITVISPDNKPKADFHANPTSAVVGSNINFYADITPEMEIESVEWVIQNGMADYVLTDFNPANLPFGLVGDFDVKLTVYSKYGVHDTIKENYIHIFEPDDYTDVVANFTATSPRLIEVGEGVQFANLSTGNITNTYWKAYSGNKEINSTQSEPKLLFAEAGVYDVRLIVFSGIHKIDTLIKENYVVVTTSDWYQENGDYCDTISNILASEDRLSYRKAAEPSWGYFPGHYVKVEENGKATKIRRYAEKFDTYVSDYIGNILLPVARAHAGDREASLKIQFYEPNQYGRPERLMENSTTKVKINTLQEGMYNLIKLKEPVKADSIFFVGLKLDYGTSTSPQDTFAISMSPNRSNDGLNTLYVSPSSTDNTKWFKPKEFLGYDLNVSSGIKILGCIVTVPEYPEIDSKLTVFPNPASDKVNISFEDLEIQDIDIKVFDVLGKQIPAHFTEQSQGRFEIDMSNAKNGFYIINTKVNQYYINRKVLISK